MPVLKTIGTTIATVFVVNKVATFGKSLGTIVAGLGKVKGMTGILAKAAPTPWTLAIGAGIGFVKTLHDMVEEEKNNAEALKNSQLQYYRRTDAQKKLSKEIEKTSKSMKEAEKARQEEVDSELALSEHTEKQVKKLDKIVDKNGKVKKGYEDEAKVITTQLSEALGININMVDNQIKGYNELRKSIQKAIATKKAEAIQSVYSEDYEKAIIDEKKLFDARYKARKDLDTVNNKLFEAEKNYYSEYNKFQRLAKMSTEDFDPIKEGFDAYTDLSTALQQTQANIDIYWSAVQIAKREQKEQNETVKQANSNYLKNQTILTNYDKLSKAIASGSIKKINTAMQKLMNNFITVETGTEKSLKNQVNQWNTYFKNLQKAYENGEPGVTKKAVNSAKRMRDQAEKELNKFKENSQKAGEQGGKAFGDGINKSGSKALNSGKNLAKESKKGAASVSLRDTGRKSGETFSKGIDSTAPKAQKSGKGLANSSKKGAESVSLKSTGKYFGEGFIAGLTSTDQTAKEMTRKWGINRVQNLNKSIESRSPSKATTRTGIYFAQGFINGIKSLNKQVKAESKSLGGASLKGILLGVDDGKFSKVGEKLVKHFTNGINSQASNIVKTMKKLITDSIPKGSSSIKKAKEEFSKIAEQLTDSFTKSFEKGASKAVKKVEKAFESISEKYQDKYDEITQKQEDLQSTLSDYGELFERDDNGKINLSNLNEQINYLKAYDTNIKALKSKVSNDLMTAITSMSAEDGADLAAKLLSLSPSELKAFDNAYQEKQKISSQIAKDYYSSEVQSLKDNFTKQIKKQLKVLKKDLKDVGKQAVDGFIKGFNSKNSKVNESVENWAENIVKTVKKQLKIKSPSRVFRYEVAGNIIDGFIKGIATRTRSAVKTMKEFSNKMTDSANISIGSAKRGMLLSSGGAVSNNNSSTYNFYQTNNSPKALSRLEIYRDTRNMIKFQAGLKGV